VGERGEKAELRLLVVMNVDHRQVIRKRQNTTLTFCMMLGEYCGSDAALGVYSQTFYNCRM
jgi:hypothetical protein